MTQFWSALYTPCNKRKTQSSTITWWILFRKNELRFQYILRLYWDGGIKGKLVSIQRRRQGGKYKPKNNKHFFCICCSHWESQRYKPTDRLASAIIVRKPKQFALRLYYLAYAVMIACDRDRQEKNECLSFLWLCFCYVATVVLILGLSRQWVKTNLWFVAQLVNKDGRKWLVNSIWNSSLWCDGIRTRRARAL